MVYWRYLSERSLREFFSATDLCVFLMTSPNGGTIGFENHRFLLSSNTYDSLARDCGTCLRWYNDRLSAETGDHYGVFASSQLGRLALHLCQQMGQDESVFYRTIDLFERFMEVQMVDVYQHIVVNEEASQRADKWRHLLERIGRQVLLRLLSCCQIASKLSVHFKIITTNEIKNMLLVFRHRYSVDSIVNSEIRVLKMLQFNVYGPTCLDYVESSVGRLTIGALAGVSPRLSPAGVVVGGVPGRWRASGETAAFHLLSAASVLLRHVYVHRAAVYSRLFRRTAAPGMPQFCVRRQLFSRVCADREVLTAAVLAAAATLQLPGAPCDRLLETLGCQHRVDAGDVVNFAEILLTSALTDRPDDVT